MARVDFYVMATAGDASRQQFACRLAEKAYRLNHTVHIRVTGPAQAEQIDDLLWTFRDGSFVPHEVLTDLPAQAPVTIGFGAAGGRGGVPELLINLTGELPQDVEAFPRIAEIVTSDDECRRRSRKLYADYRARGHSLESHRV